MIVFCVVIAGLSSVLSFLSGCYEEKLFVGTPWGRRLSLLKFQGSAGVLTTCRISSEEIGAIFQTLKNAHIRKNAPYNEHQA